MALDQHLSTNEDLHLITSVSESDASGLSVGRLNLPSGTAIKGAEVVEATKRSGLDLVIFRYPSDKVEMAAQLQDPELKVLQADTLLYFASDLTTHNMLPTNTYVLVANESHLALLETTVRSVFGDYTNHYASNPAFRAINVAEAYVDWTQTLIQNSNYAVLLQFNSDNECVGMALLDERDKCYTEILLAGIMPNCRREGHYAELLIAISNRSMELAKTTVTISTQASNIGVMRAWCRAGFLPTHSINTIHLMKVL